jgi:hypothetical protein
MEIIYQYSYAKLGIFIYLSYICNLNIFMLIFCLYNMCRNPSYLYFNSLLLFYFIDVCSTYEKLLIIKTISLMIIYNNYEIFNRKIDKLNIIRSSLFTLDDSNAKETNYYLFYINKTENIIRNKLNKIFSKIDIIITNILNNKNVNTIITIVDEYINVFINKCIEKHKEIYNNIINKILNVNKKKNDINDEIDSNLKDIDILMEELDELKNEELDEDYKKDIDKKKENLEFIKNINFKDMLNTLMKIKDMKTDKLKNN